MTSYRYDVLKRTIEELMANNEGKFVLENGAVNVLIDKVVFDDEGEGIKCYEQDKLWIVLDSETIDFEVYLNVLEFWDNRRAF